MHFRCLCAVRKGSWKNREVGKYKYKTSKLESSIDQLKTPQLHHFFQLHVSHFRVVLDGGSNFSSLLFHFNVYTTYTRV